MIVPNYWAEGRARQPRHGRKGQQVTVRRWGWSDDSQAAAQTHADTRAREALARIVAGEDRLVRREPRVPYNGAEGVPIREEIVARHGETVITRNSYGALCLNTPNVLFADIDFWTPQSGESCAGCLAGIAGLMAGGLALGFVAGTLVPAAVAGIATILGMLVGAIGGGVLGVELPTQLAKAYIRLLGGSERIALRRVEAFFQRHPDWSGRLYRSPAGFRLLATHTRFDPTVEDVAAAFRALGVDPVYAKMCRRQACFRARVSPKPWRVGVSDHLKPRPGTWPVNPERIPDRLAWVERYVEASDPYASCRFLETLGPTATCPEALEVQRLHDELCKAHSDLPIA